LAAANSAILSLESKVRVLNRPDSETNVGEMLANIKAAAERDIQRYKEEAEAMFAKNVGTWLSVSLSIIVLINLSTGDLAALLIQTDYELNYNYIILILFGEGHST